MKPCAEVRIIPTAAQVGLHYGKLTDKVFLITGASSGIGLECAKALVGAGATVFIACRPGAKALAAAEQLEAAGEAVGGKVHVLECDLGSQDSVKSCANKFLGHQLPLHALINNAGLNGVPTWGQFTPGVESQFAVNFLGHFLLTQLLHEILVSTEGARVVNIASESHRSICEERFDMKKQLPPKKSAYSPLRAYAFSNLCRILWTRQLARNVPYPVVCVHPSVVGGTGMMQHMDLFLKVRQVCRALWWELRPNNPLQTLEQGARAQTWLAVAPLQEVRELSGTYICGNLEGRRSLSWRGVIDTTAVAARDDLASDVYNFATSYFNPQ